MAWRVELTARAERDLEQIYSFINAADSAAAERWFDGLEGVIEGLNALPERGTVTDYDPNLRFLLYGNRPHIYRILYRIHGHSGLVIVTHIRHGARRPLAKPKNS